MDARPLGRRSPIPLPVFLASAVVLIFCSLFSALVFERVPHVNDEIAYMFQARLFLSGRLYATSPCGRGSFDFPHIINNGRWYSIYPPGFPLLLVPGLLVRAPWLINPILAALAVILFYLLGNEIYGRRAGRLAALLAAVSPWFLLMSSTMMSHTSSMFFNALFLLFLFRYLRKPSSGVALAAGVCWGLAFLIRPLSAVFFSLVFLVFFCARLLKNLGNGARKKALPLPASALVFICVLLIYNALTNGSPFRMGYLVRYGPSYSVIFGRAATLESEFTPLTGAVQMVDNLRALNSDLFGWPASSFLAMLPLLFLWRGNREGREKDLLLLGGIICLVAVFSFFWGAFVFIGARMLFDALPLLLLLSARGLAGVPGLIKGISPKWRESTVNGVGVVVVAVLALYAFGCRFPRILRPPHSGWYLDRYDYRFAGTSARLGRTLADLTPGRALILLKFWQRPPSSFAAEGGWGSGFLNNDPDLKSDIIYARAGDKGLDELFGCYPDRKIFIYAGTLDKGLIIPLKKIGPGVELGEPVAPLNRLRDAVEIVTDPARVFVLYSAEFSGFIRDILEETRLLEFDGRRLERMGLEFESSGDFRRAGFCFEAALQVENDPAVRRDLLNRLIPCYRRTGETGAAQKITAFMEKVGFNERRLYGVLPERGF